VSYILKKPFGCFAVKIRVAFILILLNTLLALPALSHALVGERAPEILSPFWINSEPLSLTSLKGKVVMVEFWTFGSYNCRNVEPQIKKWHHSFSGKGLVIIGVHSPEFSFEKDIEAVERYVKENAVLHPIAIDNTFTIWKNFKNRYWPTLYLIDKSGIIRYIRIGEGGYNQTEDMIIKLLGENL